MPSQEVIPPNPNPNRGGRNYSLVVKVRYDLMPLAPLWNAEESTATLALTLALTLTLTLTLTLALALTLTLTLTRALPLTKLFALITPVPAQLDRQPDDYHAPSITLTIAMPLA